MYNTQNKSDITRTQSEQACKELNIQFVTKSVLSGFYGTEYQLKDNKRSDVKKIEKHLGVRTLFKGDGKRYSFHVTYY